MVIFVFASFKSNAQCNPATFQGVFNITQTSADPTISNNGGGSNYLEYGTGLFIPGTGAMAGAGGTLVAIPTNSNHLILAGLLPGTTYYIYTRKNCSGNWSSNSAGYMFMTSPFTMSITSNVPTSICNDAAFNVSFVTNATSYAGNTYSVELSDANGSFGGPFPIIIGTLNSTLTTGTIPVNLAPHSPQIIGGSGYRIRVNSSSPAATGATNGSNITISEMIQNGIANIQSSGTLFFCGPDSRTFTVGPIMNATNYTWAAPPGATITSGQGTQSCTISFPSTGASGMVTVFGSNANCSGPPLDVLVNANPRPDPPLLSNISGCSGVPINLSLLNPMASGFSVANPYVGPGTTYTATVTDVNGCTSLPSAPANITINPLPSATITAGSPTTFCSGGNTILNATVNANYIYQWKKGTNLIAGANASSYTATTGGYYKVIVTNTLTGCSKTTGAATIVTVNALPPATITPQGPTTFCAGGSVALQANSGAGLSYKWKKGANFISGATLPAYTASVAGTYRVLVTNSNGCSRLSSGTSIIVNCRDGITENSESKLEVFPNPTNGTVSLKFISNENKNGIVILTDITGKELMQEQVVLNEGENAITLNIGHFVNGVYLVKLKSSNYEVINKIIIQ